MLTTRGRKNDEMLFAIICVDKPSSLEIRKTNREAHLDFLKNLGDRLKAGGPLLDGEGNPAGSLLIVEADSQEGARAISEKDPYGSAGLFEEANVQQWNRVFWEAAV